MKRRISVLFCPGADIKIGRDSHDGTRVLHSLRKQHCENATAAIADEHDACRSRPPEQFFDSRGHALNHFAGVALVRPPSGMT